MSFIPEEDPEIDRCDDELNDRSLPFSNRISPIIPPAPLPLNVRAPQVTNTVG